MTILNKIEAPDLYLHMINGRAWVNYNKRWRLIYPLRTFTSKRIVGLKYPLKYRYAPGKWETVFKDTVILSTDEHYWSLATVVIHDGDLNELARKQDVTQRQNKNNG